MPDKREDFQVGETNVSSEIETANYAPAPQSPAIDLDDLTARVYRLMREELRLQRARTSRTVSAEAMRHADRRQ